jgi:predicted XRE-type DNA-binding protein
MKEHATNDVGHVTKGDVLDDLGFDPQTALELKLKYALYRGIVQFVEKKHYTPRDLEAILELQQPRVSELLTGKLGTLSIKRLLWYLYKLGGIADVKVRPKAA